MADIQLIKQIPYSMYEIKEKLEAVKKRDKELNFRANKTLEYLNLIVKIKTPNANDLKKELQNLKLDRLKPLLISKLIDVLPRDIDSIRMLFSSENLSLKEDELRLILDVVDKYAQN